MNKLTRHKRYAAGIICSWSAVSMATWVSALANLEVDGSFMTDAERKYLGEVRGQLHKNVERIRIFGHRLQDASK